MRELIIEKFEEPNEIWYSGALVYKNNHGLFHRDEDKPSIIWPNRNKMWHKDGKLHRDGNKPAVIYSNGDKHWYKNGNLYASKKNGKINYF